MLVVTGLGGTMTGKKTREVEIQQRRAVSRGFKRSLSYISEFH